MKVRGGRWGEFKEGSIMSGVKSEITVWESMLPIKLLIFR